jgi:hypothetical protein
MTPTQRASALRLIAVAEKWAYESAQDITEEVALLRELAVEPVQEPVAWGVFVDDELFKPFNCKDEAVDWLQAQYNHGSRYDYLVLPLYAAPQQRKPSIEPFVVRHYAFDERSSIKGNGFDGLAIGEDREEAECFIKFVNAAIKGEPT